MAAAAASSKGSSVPATSAAITSESEVEESRVPAAASSSRSAVALGRANAEDAAHQICALEARCRTVSMIAAASVRTQRHATRTTANSGLLLPACCSRVTRLCCLLPVDARVGSVAPSPEAVKTAKQLLGKHDDRENSGDIPDGFVYAHQRSPLWNRRKRHLP